jgi:hypothetical protein
MSWAWITGDLTEHEMEEEHGLELEKVKAQQKGELKEFKEATDVRGGRTYAIRREAIEREGEGEKEKSPSLSRLYGIVQGFNETIKNWKGM